MKKNIFIVRHGHADFSAANDYDRVLTLSGIHAVNNTAHFINQTCKDNNISIDLCLSSAANRTKQTAEIICFKCDIQNYTNHKELYSTAASNWLDKMSDSTSNNIVIVGHNPTLSKLVNNLCGHEIYMQPANCAFVSLEIKSDGIIYPAQLKNYFNNE